MSGQALPPLSVYVHLPWCVAKCPYCDFNSHVMPDRLPQERYVDTLLGDLCLDAPAIAGREVQSVFFGGGTPSLFSPAAIARALRSLRAEVPLIADAEVTLEANPGTIEHGRFEEYRRAGVTRVSLGVQSFDESQLKTLGRIHDSAQVEAAVKELRQAGLENFNLDLMYGLPNQDPRDALEDVRRAIELGPTHISHYQLTMEPGTVFYHRRPPLPDDDATWAMQMMCQEVLARHGFQQYEVSAYAQAGRRCVHNINYWEFGDYLGLGAGAHGKWTEDNGDQRTIVRSARIKQPREYLASAPAQRLSERTRIERRELPFEFALNALRLNDGFTLELFESRTGLSRSAITEPLRAAKQKGLIAESAACDGEASITTTALGKRFLNDVVELFLPDGST